MGGTVAVTLRKPDGTEYRMDRWTNSMPWGICNMRMLNSDPKHIDNYLKQWVEMRDDWEKNGPNGPFEYEMTDCYFPSAGLAPCGYGLVVVDHVNKVILEMQNYTSFDSMHAAGIALEAMGGVLGVKPGDDDSDYNRFKEFWDAGRITKWMTQDSPMPTGPHFADRDDCYLPIDKTFDEVMEIIHDREAAFRIFDFKVDLGDWTLESFDECSADALKAMRERILELGFELTDEENGYWEEAIKEYEDYD